MVKFRRFYFKIARQTEFMKIKVIILNYNGMEHLPECLQSTKSINCDNFEVIVIDNNSSDNSVDYIAKEHSEVKVVRIDKNLMFADGYNYFFNQDKEDCFYMILNNDTIVDSNILKNFLIGVDRYGENNIYGCKIMYESEPNKIWYAGGEINLNSGLIRHIGIRQEDAGLQDCITDYITGCCMFLRSSTMKKLNGFDGQFDMYMEDVDLCLRAQKEGVDCYFLKDPTLYHKVSSSMSINSKIFSTISSYVKLSVKHLGIFSIFNVPLFLIRRLLSI